jgi:signal transduction histidine kinase
MPRTAKRKSLPSPNVKLRILVLEDNIQDRELICSRLEEESIDCEMIFTSGRHDFKAALEAGGFNMVFSDYSLPQFDGISALQMVRRKDPDVPFILISGELGEEQAVECLKLGATDYILKQRLARLGPAVRRAWQEAEARARQRRADEALHELSGRLLRLQDEERRRIARELHNTLAQNLLALSLNLNFAQRLVPTGEGQLQTAMVECVNLADDTAKALRHVSYLLHPPALDSIGLPGALSDYVSGFSRRTGIKVGLHVQKKFGRLPGEIETALYRIVQESLANVQAHSGSASAKVELRRDDGTIVVEIQDAGRGLPPHTLQVPRAPGSIGIGIPGMRERLQLLHGRLEIQSSSAGTCVRAVLPQPVAP